MVKANGIMDDGRGIENGYTPVAMRHEKLISRIHAK
jgi:hypothetical protein